MKSFISKIVSRWLLILFLLLINLRVFAQVINISYPLELDSHVGQILNIPILVENVSNQVLTVQADYFNLFHSTEFSYRINKITYKTLLPGKREIIFLSLTPNPDILAGKRFFPFLIQNENENALATGVIEINHIVEEDFVVRLLDNYRYIIPDIDLGISLFLHNKGTVPVEFKIARSVSQPSTNGNFNGSPFWVQKILQPSQSETVFVPFSQIDSLVETEFWMSYTLDYTLTKILPEMLKVEEFCIRRVVPVAHKTSYPFQKDYYILPITASQSYMYDESMFASKNVIRQYITNVYGNGFLDDNYSVYMNFNINYRILDHDFNDDEEWYDKVFDYDNLYFNFNWRTRKFNVSVGENSYLLDQRAFPKYGMGAEIGYYNKGLILERVSMKELYGEEAIHNRTSIGYSWNNYYSSAVQSMFYEPDNYIKLSYYQKNNQDENEIWVNETKNSNDYLGRWFLNSEHEKYVLETQAKIFSDLTINLEVYGAHENDSNDYLFAGFSTGVFFNTKYIMNRFSMNYDDLNIINEAPKKVHYNNELNIYSNYLDIYSNVRYRDEYYRMGKDFTDRYISHNVYGNVYLNFISDYYLRFKIYDSAVDQKTQNGLSYEEREYLFGTMYKNKNYELELLYGWNTTETHNYAPVPNYRNIISFNAWVSRLEDYKVTLLLNNRTEFDQHEFNMRNQANFYYKWSDNIQQSIGAYSIYYNMQNWRNYLLLSTNFSFHLPWKHLFSLGGSYNVNPNYSNNYRYSILAEYAIPFNAKLFPKSDKKYMTMTFQENRQPTPGVVFEMDNNYFVTNNAGVIRVNKENFNPNSFNIVNIPPGYAISPDLSTLIGFKGNKANFTFTELSSATIKVRKLSYERVSINSETPHNSGYYHNSLINIDRFTINDYTEPLEIMLRNVDNNTIVQKIKLNHNGIALFNNLTAGTYEILINDTVVSDNLILETNVIRLNHGDHLEKEIIVKERYTRFRN